MNFIKKNGLYLILTLALCAVLLVPSFRNFFSNQFLMKPSLNKVEESVSLKNTDLQITLKGINTPNIQLSNLQGKPIFLNFWGSWCPPCRAEFPSIQKLYEKKGNQIYFVLIAMQDQESEVRKFIAENKYTAPVYIAESPIPDRLLPSVFPTTLILDTKKRIVKKEESAENWDKEEIHSFLENLMKIGN